MRNSIRCLTAACGLTFCSLQAAETTPVPRQEKKELRVLAATPDSERRVTIGRAVEKEKVTFLGVETSPVSNPVAAQLGLAKGLGLVVNHVVAGSAAAGVLQENDILLRLDDQILIETRQLAVLVRNHKEGDEVTLTYLRAAKQSSARIKLTQKEVPKVSAHFEQWFPRGGGPGNLVLAPGSAGDRSELAVVPPGQPREEVDRVLSLIQPAPGHEPIRVRIERKGGPGYRATSINTANSNLSYCDDDGSLELSAKDGKKTLVAKNSRGEQLFSGLVTTPEERSALPEAVRQRLEKLEGMHNITFHTDRDFFGAEARTLQPAARGIALPLPAGAPRPLRGPAIFF